MKKFTLLFALITFTNSLFAQQGDGGRPKSEKNTLSDNKTIDKREFAEPDINTLRAEDALNDSLKTGPWRFGYNHSVGLNLSNSGTWITRPNGDQIWRLHIACENALTVNLTFKDVQLPEGNELFVYNTDKSFILGKFTAYHLYKGALGTELVPGSSAIIEYYIPAKNSQQQASLTLETVTHGYRTAKQFIEKAFNGSGTCNMNVNCPDGSTWTNQRNGVVMLVSGSNGFCSGSLMNNVSNNGKPYVLTANHCYSNPASWIFRFKWEAPSCTNPTSSPSFLSLSGAVLRSRRTPSDFCLVEITGGLVNNTIPTSYTPYFSGWDNTGQIPTSATCIHHPAGDIKKISFDDDPLTVSQGMNSTEANATWKIYWDRNTTTQGGSSGSPLFDQNHRIIGQLWGGGASCTNLTAADYYGRIANSWSPAGSDSTSQLKYWVDPTNSGASFIDGYDPTNSPNITLDAGLNNVKGAVGTICSGTVSPVITLSNSGSATLTTLTINYGFDGNTNQTYTWSGSLAQWQTTTITLPSTTLTGGNHTFFANVVSPNGGTDQNTLNNTTTSSFTTITNGETLTLNLKLDCWASETTWKLTTSTNQVLFSGGGYVDNNPTLVQENFCVNKGCYYFKIYDQYGDGMSSCNAAKGGPGYFAITFNGATVAQLLQADANFGDSLYKTICIGVNELEKLASGNNVAIYPNPASNMVTINSPDALIEKVELISLTGQVLVEYRMQENTSVINLKEASGIYILTITTNKGIVRKQLILSN